MVRSLVVTSSSATGCNAPLFGEILRFAIARRVPVDEVSFVGGLLTFTIAVAGAGTGGSLFARTTLQKAGVVDAVAAITAVDAGESQLHPAEVDALAHVHVHRGRHGLHAFDHMLKEWYFVGTMKLSPEANRMGLSFWIAAAYQGQCCAPNEAILGAEAHSGRSPRRSFGSTMSGSRDHPRRGFPSLADGRCAGIASQTAARIPRQ